MKKYSIEEYGVDGIIPQDVLTKLQAHKDELNAEVCRIEALIAIHRSNKMDQHVMKNRLLQDGKTTS